MFPPQAFRLDCQSTSLVVVESHSSVSELLAQNPILLAQILECLQLALIHPASQGNYHELDRIKNSRHLVRSLSQPSSRRHNLRRFTQIEFSDQTGAATHVLIGISIVFFLTMTHSDPRAAQLNVIGIYQ